MKAAAAYFYNHQRGEYHYDSEDHVRCYDLLSKGVALEEGSSGDWAFVMLGHLAVLRDDLNVAKKEYEKAGGKYKFLLEALEKSSDGKSLTIQGRTNFIEEIYGKVKFFFVKELINQTIFSEDHELGEHLTFIRRILNLLNEKNIKFEYTAENQSLDISNNKELSKIAPIRNLPIRILDLSHTNVEKDFKYLKMLDLVSLDVSNTRMNDYFLRNIKGMPLQHLNLEQCKVHKLSDKVFQDLPIETINIAGIPARNFSVFEKLRNLTRIICDHGQVRGINKLNLPDTVEIVVLGDTQ